MSNSRSQNLIVCLETPEHRYLQGVTINYQLSTINYLMGDPLGIANDENPAEFFE